MSADNGIIIREIGNGKFSVHEYCASVDYPEEPELAYPMMSDYGTFDSMYEAVKAAQSCYTEYGITFDLFNQP